MITIVYILGFLVAVGRCDIDYSDRPRNFSIELVHFTAQQTGGHVVVSPFGIWTLMNGIALGATGGTYEEIRRAFFLPRNERKMIIGYGNLTKIVLNPTTPEVTLTSKNFMFLDRYFQINDEFLSVIQTDFQATVSRLDFNDPKEAAKTANGYIQNSGARVSNVLTSEDFAESRMILTNVISFKGLWGLPFNKTDTIEEKFYNERREPIGRVNMMYQRGKFPYGFFKELNGHVLELPYGSDGKYSMLILLPFGGNTTTDMYMRLETISLKDIFRILQEDAENYGVEDVDVRIPRFKVSSNIVMNKPLNDMGVYKVFDPLKSSFERVTKEPLFVSAIVHKAEIEVTESGTVAAASSTADFADRISTPSFAGNRPFIYFVMEKSTTTMIFGGIYSKPAVY
ncbi:serine protease inhibitor 77Ba-like [Plutella xylostella]|uniref:serine protease inhibitor 77Ba-like n=1 Tax=Plutella xylostella TaxID=51655 RepID=UPI0020330AB6|nr:serine protease inhibitor 77Ba-like [Plutella xylostella]